MARPTFSRRPLRKAEAAWSRLKLHDGRSRLSAQLTKIKAANPDVIFLPAYYNDVPLIAQQARRLGIDVATGRQLTRSSPEIIKLGGADINESYFCNHYSTEIATPVAQEVCQRRYKAEMYGMAPDDVAALTCRTPLVCWPKPSRRPESWSDKRSAML